MSSLEELVLADKPAGISTHSPTPQILGFVEYLSEKLKTKLFVCHRLDKETSGAIIFAKSKNAVSEIGELFEHHQVKKRYVFITDRKPDLAEQIQIETEISKSGQVYISKQSVSPNSLTRFQKRTDLGRFALWEAYPLTGKTHQIRLHARELGIPILGDTQYQGTFFPRLMLHAEEISFIYQGQEVRHVSILPDSFRRLDVLEDSILAQYFSCLDRRQRLYNLQSETNNTYRIVHNQGWGMSADLLGSYLWCYWYDQQLPLAPDLERIKKLAEALNVKGWKIQLMQNRGKDPIPQEQLSTIDKDRWFGKENDVTYIFKREQGYSPGLFLDQRQNRLWLKENCNGKRVLNLFCYTAGFSLCAALGGATEVVSVDTSKTTLDWARENFVANNLDYKSYEFWAADTRYFLAGAKKKGRRFDIIICDPPSFARNKQGVFKLDRDFQDLVRELSQILAPRGRILFSLNLEKWSYARFREEISNLKLSDLRIEEPPIRDLDFEMPGEDFVMKSLFIISP